MTDEPVVITTDGPVTTLRINRPDKENRLNLSVLTALQGDLDAADADPSIHAVVITGTGETFCCGGDLEEFAAGDRAAYETFGEAFAAVHLAIATLAKPVLAAVNGHVRAGGMSLLALCDLAVARAAVQFAMPEIKAGIWPVMAMVSLNRVLPRKRAFELYYFGESFNAEEARALGLVNWIVPHDHLEPSVQKLARQLAALPPRAIAVGRTTFAGIAERTLADGYTYSAGRLVELLTDPEAAQDLSRAVEEP